MRNKKKLLSVVAVLILLLGCLFGCSSGGKDGNLIANGGFETVSKGIPKKWQTDLYDATDGVTTFALTTEAYAGNYSLMIRNDQVNDARMIQRVKVKPETVYLISGYIKTVDMQGVIGANISVLGSYSSFPEVYGTSDWQKVEFYAKTGEDQRRLTVCARAGFYGSTATGTAYFDEISVTKVDKVPDGAEILDVSEYNSKNTGTTKKQDKQSLAIVLLGAAAAVIMLMMISKRVMADKLSLVRAPINHRMLLIVLLVIAFAVRVALALSYRGFESDMSCFSAWSERAAAAFASGTPADFYREFCDYTPGYIYLLAIVGGIRNLFGIAIESKMHWLLLKLPSIIADLGIMYLMYRVADKKFNNKKIGLILAAMVGIAPLFIVNSAAWGQIESVLSLLLMLAVYRFGEKRYTGSFIYYILALLVKPQALLVGPVFFFMAVGGIFRKEERAQYSLGSYLSILFPLVIVSVCVGLLVVAEKYILYNSFLTILVYELIICALIAGVYFLARFLNKKGEFASALPKMMVAAAVAVLVFLAGVIPFTVSRVPMSTEEKDQYHNWVVQQYTSTMGGYEYATLSAFNIHALIGRNMNTDEPAYGDNNCKVDRNSGFDFIRGSGQWKDDDTVAFGDVETQRVEEDGTLVKTRWVTYKQLGTFLLILLIAFIAYLCFSNPSPKFLGLYSALMLAGVFVFYTMMHERYIFLTIPMLLVAYLQLRDRRILKAAIGFGFTAFVNIALVLFVHQTVENYISGDNLYLRLFSLANIALFIYLAVITWNMALNRGRQTEKEEFSPEALERKKRIRFASLKQDKTVFSRFTKKDYLIMIAITAVYAAISFVNLGTTNVPEKYWQPASYQETVTAQLAQPTAIHQVLVYENLGEGGFDIEASMDGVTWRKLADYTLNYRVESTIFRWESTMDKADQSPSLYRYVRIKPTSIGFRVNEIILCDAEKNPIPIADVFETYSPEENSEHTPKNAFNEQETAPEVISFVNGMYFDEIYHARTAYEFNNSWTVYETTHPPLGKALMSLGTAVFGMNPFGWRVVGNLFGILMVPLMYLFGKRIFNNTTVAAVLSGIMALDGMHFVQTRIATIDVYGVFFIILMFYFMYKYYMMNFYTDKLSRTFLPLLGCGIAFGLGIASKWIGLYAGLGLAIIFLMSIGERFTEYLQARKQLAANPDVKNRKALQKVVDSFAYNAAATVLFCLLAFVVIPIIIYCLSYIPYLRAQGSGSWFSRIWKNQTHMLSYHSGLVNDKHDFRSQWIEWPLMLRPMWYYGSNNYSGLADGVKSTIACFGNPLIWYTGLVATIGGAVSLRRIRKALRNSALTDSETMELVRKRKTLLFTFVGLLTSYLPWVLVARSTFIYHYFASLPFIMIFIAYYVKELLDKKGKKGFNIVMVSMLAVLAVSILLYPIWSGLPVNVEFIENMKWFGSWYF